jgi:hypothetical protein
VYGIEALTPLAAMPFVKVPVIVAEPTFNTPIEATGAGATNEIGEVTTGAVIMIV